MRWLASFSIATNNEDANFNGLAAVSLAVGHVEAYWARGEMWEMEVGCRIS